MSRAVAHPSLGGGAVHSATTGSQPWALVLTFWLAAAVPSASLGWLLTGVGIALPLFAPRILPLFVLTSCFFYSTMAVSSSVLYALRAYWIAAFLLWFLVLRRSHVERRIWIWILVVGVLLAWGTLVATIRVGQVDQASRSAVFEAAVAVVWLLGLVVGWAWLRSSGGRLQRGEVAAITCGWLVAVGYGVAQALFGVTEATVPPDIWPHLEGFQQYEDLGRHPFASLTANGMAATTMLPVVLLLGVAHRSLAGTALVLAIALLVGMLTLTRSYILLLLLLLLFLPPLQRTRVSTWLAVLGAAVLGSVAVLQLIDPQLLSLSLRLEGDVTSLRADIWNYTLRNMAPQDWLLGMGFGSVTWERFFAPMALLKELASPHSALLDVAGQFGIAGVAVYLSIVATVLRAYMSNRREPARAAVALALLLVMVRELLATSYIFSPSILATFFWLVFGMVLAQSPASSGSHTNLEPERHA